MSKLVVIGGGITGLAAAWQGVCDGADVTVLESSNAFGGKLKTHFRDGLLIEQGPDSFIAYKPAALSLIRELGMEDEVILPRGTRKVSMHARGKLRPLPDGMGMVLPTKILPFATTGVLSWADKIRAGYDLILPRQLPPHDVSIGWLLRRRLGKGLMHRFADPLVGGIYGASVDELSIDAVLPSLRENEEQYRSLIVASIVSGRRARKKAAGQPVRGAQSPFRSLRGGMASLVEELVRQLSQKGAELRLNAEVRAVLDHGVELADGEFVAADAIVFAGGVQSSQRLLESKAPEASAQLGKIPLASTNIVTLVWPRQAFASAPSGHGWLETDKAPISGVTISSLKWEGRAGEDTIVLRAFVPEKVGEVAAFDDDAMTTAVVEHLRPLLGVTAPPSLQEITRWNHVMPKYIVGHLDVVAETEHALQAHPHWKVAGSALYGAGIPDCIDSGRTQASAALAGL